MHRRNPLHRLDLKNEFPGNQNIHPIADICDFLPRIDQRYRYFKLNTQAHPCQLKR